ncbi:MAG: antibiotic biosynthesis monooxygenase [Spirochaetia bacterium]|jgi:autoinducer 2-degrading protein|nr:antibiotic biosynthesis monooxygenase [Spirochaetia bacterium]
MDTETVVYLVNIYVKKGFENVFMEATKLNRAGTRKEPGNIRFDLLGKEGKEGEFLLFEVYESQGAVNEHKKTAHYAAWRESVEGMMEKPREGIKYSPLLSDDYI